LAKDIEHRTRTSIPASHTDIQHEATHGDVRGTGKQTIAIRKQGLKANVNLVVDKRPTSNRIQASELTKEEQASQAHGIWLKSGLVSV
jgi:hypothetical protein